MPAVEMLSEPAVVPDTYASGLSHIEDLGDGNWRMTLYTQQDSIYGGTEYVVVARYIMPTQAIFSAIKTVMRATGRSCCEGKRRGLLQ